MEVHENQLDSNCYSLSSSFCFDSSCYGSNVDLDDAATFRRKRLLDLVELKFEGNKASLGRALGYRDGAFVGQMIRGERPITEKTMAQVHDLPGGSGWFGGIMSANITLPMPTLDAHITSGNAESAGLPRMAKPTPVVGTARMGDNGYYEEFGYPEGNGDGWVDSYSPDPNAYALRVKGDSMHPAIRHGSFVVVEPNGVCMPGEYVALVLVDGRKMVKELVIERADEIVIESVNGNHRQTLDRAQIEKMHPIAAIVAASKWRQL